MLLKQGHQVTPLLRSHRSRFHHSERVESSPHGKVVFQLFGNSLHQLDHYLPPFSFLGFLLFHLTNDSSEISLVWGFQPIFAQGDCNKRPRCIRILLKNHRIAARSFFPILPVSTSFTICKKFLKKILILQDFHLCPLSTNYAK